MQIDQIQNQELRELIKDSFKFSLLTSEQQEKMLTKLSSATEKNIRESYIPFFKNENKMEDDIVKHRETKLEELIERAEETKRYIKRKTTENREAKVQSIETQEEQNLLHMLDDL